MKYIAKFFKILFPIIGVFGIFIGLISILTFHHACRSVFETKVFADLRAIGGQIELFHEDNGRYPDSVTELVGGYLKAELLDPWGNSYQIRFQDDKPILYTYNKERVKTNFGFRIEYGI